MKKGHVLAVMLVWVAVNVFFRGAGGHFLGQVDGLWQIVDSQWLRSDFWAAIGYFHATPPLFNAYLGVVEIASFGNAGNVHTVVFFVLGGVALVAMLRTLALLGVHDWIAGVVVLGVVLTPSWVMYQNWLMYTFPTMVLLSLVLWFALEAIMSERAGWVVMCVLTAVALVWLRAVFHWGWVLLIAAVLVWKLPTHRRAVVAGTSIVFVAALMLPIKNGLLFGAWTSSTFLGPNLYAMTDLVAYPVKEDLWAAGNLSPVSRVRHFSDVGFYPEALQAWDARGVTVLDERYKPGGAVNFNHGTYVRIHQAYQKDALRLMWEAPWDYGRQVVRCAVRFGNPAWVFHEFDEHSDSLTGWLAWSAGGVIALPDSAEGASYERYATHVRTRPGFTWIHVAVGVVMALAVWMMVAPKLWRLSNEQHAFLCVAGITMLWVTLVAVTCMPVENYRLRFVLTPIYVCIVGRAAILSLTRIDRRLDV